MNTKITIARREEKTINGRDILNIWDTNGVRYTHFIEARNLITEPKKVIYRSNISSFAVMKIAAVVTIQRQSD